MPCYALKHAGGLVISAVPTYRSACAWPPSGMRAARKDHWKSYRAASGPPRLRRKMVGARGGLERRNLMGRLIRQGCKGADVRAVQDVLNFHIRRLAPLSVDGDFG